MTVEFNLLTIAKDRTGVFIDVLRFQWNGASRALFSYSSDEDGHVMELDFFWIRVIEP